VQWGYIPQDRYIHRLSQTPGLKVAQVNVQDLSRVIIAFSCSQLSQKFLEQEEIRVLPAYLVYKGGRRLGKVEGCSLLLTTVFSEMNSTPNPEAG
jgi:hypothetical protein